MGAPVLNGPFVMPMFRSFVPRKMQTVDLSLHRRHLPAFGRSIFGGIEPYDRRHGSDARGYPLMCMYANLAGMAIYFPLLFRMKFRFTNKTLLTSAALGVLLCKPDSAAHHFPSAVVADMLHRRNVQDSGNFRMYVQHSVMDDAQA